MSLIHPSQPQPMERLSTNSTAAPSTEPLLTLELANCSAWDQRRGAPYLAHLDVQLYQEFYAMWVALMVRWRSEGPSRS